MIPRSEIRRTVNLTSGAEYDFKGMGRSDKDGNWVWIYPPGRYRVIAGSAQHVRTFQELVVYEGLEGRDEGRVLCCPVADFARLFTERHEAIPEPDGSEGQGAPVEAPPKVPFVGGVRRAETPEKVFGVAEGTGV